MAGRVLRETEFLGGGEGIRRRKGNQGGKTQEHVEARKRGRTIISEGNPGDPVPLP